MLRKYKRYKNIPGIRRRRRKRVARRKRRREARYSGLETYGKNWQIQTAALPEPILKAITEFRADRRGGSKRRKVSGFQRCQFHLESVFQLDHDKFPNSNEQFRRGQRAPLLYVHSARADIIKFTYFPSQFFHLLLQRNKPESQHTFFRFYRLGFSVIVVVVVEFQ